jgi:hypothetical protein
MVVIRAYWSDDEYRFGARKTRPAPGRAGFASLTRHRGKLRT